MLHLPSSLQKSYLKIYSLTGSLSTHLLGIYSVLGWGLRCYVCCCLLQPDFEICEGRDFVSLTTESPEPTIVSLYIHWIKSLSLPEYLSHSPGSWGQERSQVWEGLTLSPGPGQRACPLCIWHSGLHEYTQGSMLRGPVLGLMLCHHWLWVLHRFWIGELHFSSRTRPHISCSWSCFDDWA